MLKLYLIILVGLLVYGCETMKKSTVITNNKSPDIVGQLPLGEVNPEEALVQIKIVLYQNDTLEGKIIKLESVGHGFREVLIPGQKIVLSTTKTMTISDGDSLICIIRRIPEGGYSLVNYKRY